MQFVRADDLLGALAGLARGVIAGHQFGADFRFQHVMQDATDAVAQLTGFGGPANEVADQRLGDAGVDVVVRHVIADAVG